MNDPELQPYLDAVEKVLDGKPVENLDQIRIECNKAYHEAGRASRYSGVNLPGLFISFIADAENKILQGADPVKTYSGYKGLEPVDFRKRGRKLIRDCLELKMF